MYCSRRNFLTAATITEDHFWLLVEVSSMHSDKMIQALRDHLVNGLPRKIIYEKHNVSSGYFSTSLNRLNHLHQLINLMQPYYTAPAREN